MKSVTGTYYKGRLKLDRPFRSRKPVRVIVTIDEGKKKQLRLSDFSFSETQELLKDCKTSFSDEVIEDRRSAI